MKANEVLKAINFKVETHPIFLKGGKEIPQRKALLRADNGHLLSVVSDRYKLLENSKVFSTPLETADASGYNIARFSILNGGRKTAVECLSKGNFNLGKVKGKDEVYKKRIIFVNSYDKKSALKMILGSWRLTCKNGAGVWVNRGQPYRVIHAGDKIDNKKVRKHIMANLKYFDSAFDGYFEQLKSLSSHRITNKQVTGILEAVKMKGNLKRIKNIYDDEYSSFASLYGLYNAVTAYHRVLEEKKNQINLKAAARTSVLLTRLINFSKAKAA
jgi:hypothetical protein